MYIYIGAYLDFLLASSYELCIVESSLGSRGRLISRTSLEVGWLERDRDDREVRTYIEMGVFGQMREDNREGWARGIFYSLADDERRWTSNRCGKMITSE